MGEDSDATPFGTAAAVVGQWSHVTDERDLESSNLQGSDGGFPAGAWSANENLDLAHALLESASGGGLRGGLGSEGGSLACALEATGSSRRPRDHLSSRVGDGDVVLLKVLWM